MFRNFSSEFVRAAGPLQIGLHSHQFTGPCISLTKHAAYSRMLGEVIVIAVIKNLPAYYTTCSFIIVFTGDCYWSLSLAKRFKEGGWLLGS
jgi:hypothetical protein